MYASTEVDILKGTETVFDEFPKHYMQALPDSSITERKNNILELMIQNDT
jgi:hypothetical protein